MARTPSSTPPPPPKSKRTSFLTNLMYISLGVLGIVILFSYAKNQWGFGFGGGGGGYTSVPQEVQIKYIPADFKPDIDEENALIILKNPYRYSREFNQLVYDFNRSLLRHVSNRMNLSDSLKNRVMEEYENHHPYLKRLYFNDFVALQDTSAANYESWYATEGIQAVQLLNEVASKYSCYLINQIMATILKTKDGSIYVSGRQVDTPCGVALTEGLAPTIARLKERAVIDDFSKSRGLLEERVEKVIAELATMEVRDRKGLNKQMQTKIWGFNVSTTEVEVTAMSIMKIGFNLQKYFDIQINPTKKIVLVTLPEPEILSHEVYPRVDKLDIGWLREIDDQDFNKNFNALRRAFREEAFENNVMQKSKDQATELMETMIGPAIYAISPTYDLQVRFKSSNTNAIDYEEEDFAGK
ncbi:MAG: DUF4230 domain-containing protein [Bacteroidota bacterium]